MESFETRNAIRPDQSADIRLDVSPGLLALILILLVGFLVPAFAQSSAPKWIQQFKLSGISGTPAQHLAIINNQTFATGEENVLKVAGRKVPVHCLEIRDHSVLIQVDGLPDPYELTLSGEVICRGAGPAAPVSQPAVVQIQTRALFPASPTIVSSPTPIGSVWAFSAPITGRSDFSALRWIGLIVLSLLVIVVAARALDRDGISLSPFPPLPVPQQKNPGEAKVANAIRSQFNRSHLLLCNVTLPTADGTAQIDHVLIADTGIFVIETKHYSGWIFGNPKEGKWTQMLNRQKFRFQNPLRQNYGHLKTLQTLFNFPAAYFHTVVVFAGNAKFKTDLGPNVVQLSGLMPFLSADRPVLLDEAERARVSDRIETERLPCSVETDELHINNVRSKLAWKSRRARDNPGYKLRPTVGNLFVGPVTASSSASEHPHARYMPK